MISRTKAIGREYWQKTAKTEKGDVGIDHSGTADFYLIGLRKQKNYFEKISVNCKVKFDIL